MNPADKSVQNATPPTDSAKPGSPDAAPNSTPPRRRWPFVALVVGLVVLGGQIYLQRDYWGLVLHEGTFFPNINRNVNLGHRESEGARRHQELPIPGSPASFAGTAPSPLAPQPNPGGVLGKPATNEAKTEP